MPPANESTTLVCLFRHFREAHGAIVDLQEAGISRSLISLIGDGNIKAKGLYKADVLSSVDVPLRDQQRFWNGLEKGGVVVAVSAVEGAVPLVERIFSMHKAARINSPAAAGARHG